MTQSTKSVTIALFRNDLRLHDNPILSYAHLSSIREGGVTRKNVISDYVLPLYIFDERQVELSGLEGYKRQGPEARTNVCGFWRTGYNRLKFQIESVYELQRQLRKSGNDLLIRFGVIETTAIKIVKALQQEGFRIHQVYINSETATEEIETENKLEELLAELKVRLTKFHTRSLVNPEDLPFTICKTPDVYTPFRKRIEELEADKLCRPLLPLPEKLKPFPPLSEKIVKAVPDTGYSGGIYANEGAEKVFELLSKPLVNSPDVFDEARGNEMEKKTAFPYKGGESDALRRLDDYFFKGGKPLVRTYKETRNGLLGESYSTKFSPFLALGCISPRKIIHSLRQHESKFGANGDTYWVLFEILWRDYFIFISLKFGSALFKLKGFEGVMDPKGAGLKMKGWKPYRDEKMNQRREKNETAIDRRALNWMKAKSGIPFLDANIREIQFTGFMSNRGRQNVASFLTKDLGLDWRIGAEFFENQLLDYDPCSNYGNWQYVAGVGNDPRSSRQFNPIKQAKDYDPRGDYVRYWLPQLSKISNDKIHVPWLLNQEEKNKLIGGGLYPERPMIEQQSWKKHYQRR